MENTNIETLIHYLKETQENHLNKPIVFLGAGVSKECWNTSCK